MTSCLQILLVEDNEHISEQIRNALTIQGLNSLVSRVSSQEAFLKAMREQTWDLILAECQIPGFEGMDAIHLARHHNPKIPIILVGEDDAPSFTEEAIKQGAAGFVLRSRLAGLGPAILHAIDRFDRFQTPSAGEDRHGSISSFRDFVENVSDWLWEEDANAVLTYSNRHVKELLGYEPQMVLGKSRFHFMPLEEADKAKNHYPPCNSVSPACWSSESIMQRQDGQLVVVETRAIPIQDRNGAHAGYRGISRDITMRKHGEIRITHLNRIYAMLSEINKASVLIRERRELFKEMCRIAVHHGQFRMAWIGLIDFHACKVHPAAWFGHEDGYLAQLQMTLSRNMEEGGLSGPAIRSGKGYVCNDIEHDERMLLCKDEALKRGYRSSAAFPIRSGEFYVGAFQLYSGEVGFFDRDAVRLLEGLALDMSFVLDALESDNWRRQAQAALRESELKYRIVADNTYDWEFWRSPTGQFNYCSPSCKRITAHHAKDFLTDPNLFLMLIHPMDLPSVRQHLQEEQEQHCGRLVFRIVRPDEEERWIEHHCQPIYNNEGLFIGSRGTNRDITERKRLEEQLRQSQKMEVIGHLSGGLAHDFSNMLTVVQGHASLLLTRSDLQADIQEALKSISLATKRASELTRQLLAFGRRHPLSVEPLNLNEVLGNLAPAIRRLLRENIELDLVYAPNLPMIQADVCMLEQVIFNLVINARDAMPHGGKLRLRTQSSELDENYSHRNPEGRAGSFVSFSVVDTGCGIDPFNLSKIFEPFFTTKESGKASGLGLCTAYGIVKQHEGWIEVHSQPGKGSTFRFFLPVAPRAVTPATPVPQEPVFQEGTECVLVVEDDAAVRGMVRRILERHGYKVIEAASGKEALELWNIRKQDVHLVLTDMIMPDGLSGRELADRLHEDCRDLKVIYMSGYCLDVAGQRIPARPGVDFLAKPFEPKELLQCIKDHLRPSAAADPLTPSSSSS